ncbi:MAG: heme-binding protein [Rhodospirillaceae bacterium]|nr:heme-binding protein [Rhodospirillaceae bacterium]
MLDQNSIEAMRASGRDIGIVTAGADGLGKLSTLPGKWAKRGVNEPLPGRGWNLIALPFANGPFGYRLLMNQYNEVLNIFAADRGVPNRGILQANNSNNPAAGDQTLVALDYQQQIVQIATEDFPESTLLTPPDKPIHHEPGLFLHALDKATDGLDVSRLGVIPHGNSILAMGKVQENEQPVGNFRDVEDSFDGRPIGIGATNEVTDPKTVIDPGKPRYLDPYTHFQQNPFRKVFRPTGTLDLLQEAFTGFDIRKTTVFDFNSAHTSETGPVHGGVLNIPFIVDQANATEVRSIFWIHELNPTGENDDPVMIMQYAQVVMLEFFERTDGVDGLIRWPHVSINTMERVSKKPDPLEEMMGYG